MCWEINEINLIELVRCPQKTFFPEENGAISIKEIIIIIEHYTEIIETHYCRYYGYG